MGTRSARRRAVRVRPGVQPVPVLAARRQERLRRLGHASTSTPSCAQGLGRPHPVRPQAAQRRRPPRRGRARAFARRLRRYGDLLTRLYAAVLEVSGAEIVVDASKHASTALVLRRHARPSTSRCCTSYATARPWRTPGPRRSRGPRPAPGSTWRPGRRPRPRCTGPARTRCWTASPRTGRPRSSSATRTSPPTRARPSPQLLAFLGRSDSADALSFVEGSSLHLDPSHTVAGNPMRFSSGVVDVVPDQAWRVAFPESRQRLVAGLTMPLRRRYGYSPRSGR